MQKVIKVEITPKTVIPILCLLGLIWIVTKTYGVIFLIFIAYAISSMLSPVIDSLYRRRVPRSLSIVLIYLLFITIIIFLILISYKPLITQVEAFTRSLPDIFVNVVNATVERVPFIKERFNWDEILKSIKENFWTNFEAANISNYLISGVGKAFGFVGSVFGILINIFTVIILSVYFLQSKESSKEKLLKLVPLKHQKRILRLLDAIENQLGSWLRAQLLLMTLIGFLGWLGLEIIGMEFSVPMGIIAGLLEIIPGIGPMITWILAVIIGVGSNIPAWKVVFIAVWFILIQQVENYLIIPKLMEKFVGINPVLTIIAILGASKIFGVWGALLAVPTVAILQISLREYMKYRKEITA